MMTDDLMTQTARATDSFRISLMEMSDDRADRRRSRNGNGEEKDENEPCTEPYPNARLETVGVAGIWKAGISALLHPA